MPRWFTRSLEFSFRLLLVAALVGAMMLVAAPFALVKPAHGQNAPAPPAKPPAAAPAPSPAAVAQVTARAEAGDAHAQFALGEAYSRGQGVAKDERAARRWYEKAAAQKLAQASRRLGEMYASGAGGRKDRKKALELWIAAEKGGDPFAAILVADELFSNLTGGKKPGPGKYAFRGGIPLQEVESVEAWYREAGATDPRPDVKRRAQAAIQVLASFKSAAQPKPGL